jgi:carboxypeptidase family protein/TonB-dependent receptor-like protein
MRLRQRWCAVAVMILLAAIRASAQSTTGTLTGHVTDGHGLALPAVTVSVSSTALQGIRTTATSEIGDYAISLLPPGTYTLTFELAGFQKQERQAILAPTERLPMDVTLGQAVMAEEVTVVAAPGQVVTQSAQAATNFRQDLLSTLPTNRDINASVLMAPSVHATGVGGAYSIAGAMSFESLFMINGVSVSDNLRGQPYDLYIEDAVQETLVATAGISAEYGRFSGGVVNVITKSGSNQFSGSFRDSLLNDKWRALTPFEQKSIAADAAHQDTRVDHIVPTYEYTIGGPVNQDRLWFFGAGRQQTQESGRALALTNIPYTFKSNQRRNEGKLTYSPRTGDRLQASYIASFEAQINQSQNFNNVMDLRSLYNARHPMNLFTMGYSGVLSHSLVVEGRYSVRNETLKDVGAPTTDPIDGTLLVDRSQRRYWSPTFCGVCDPEQRDGQELFAKGSYFRSARRLGSHQMVFGYDGYDDRRLANNHQSGSDYRIINTNVILQGTTLTPQILADGATMIQWNPIFTTSSGTNFRTHSLFYNDNWRVSNRLTANFGLRYDRNHALDSSNTLVTSQAAWSPRLGVVLDPLGNQTWSITGNIAKYVDGIANLVANAAATGGNPDTYQFAYLGPDINRDPNGPLTPAPAAVAQVLSWFKDHGGATLPIVGNLNVVGVSTVIGKNLTSPNVWEYATGVNRQIGNRAAVRADLIVRRYQDFYSIRTDTTTGTVKDNRPNAPPGVVGRVYDLSVVENTSIPRRRYAGLSLQGQYRFRAGIDAGATYTLSHASGNIDGETPAGPGGAVVSQYPEYKQASWNYPEGDLAIDQRHRARIWATYLPAWFRGLSLSALQTLESGVPYGAVSNAGVNPQPFVTNPGYQTPPGGTTTTYYFTARDAFRTDGQERTDFAASYHYTLKNVRGLQLFGQLQILNAFNRSQLCGCGAATVFADGGAVMANRIDQTVRTAITNPALYQAFNPFTTTPVRGVNWDYGPNFGAAINRFAYTTPRTLRITFGVRF